MGVTGLWRLIDASGKPVPVETLEGKVLAIDISIWIHQVLQGYQDRRGGSVPNAHLLGLYNRICKLLYFKIKPVFVFDGGVPLLKKNTIAARKKYKARAAGKAESIKNDLIHNLMKHSLVKGVLGKKLAEESSVSDILNSKSNSVHDMYKLPELPSSLTANADDYDSTDSDSPAELSPRKEAKWKGNIHNVDVNTDDFKALPADVRYDILTDLKETRKQNSWGRLHEMPDDSQQFSGFQMRRLLKRRQVQESLEVAEKEMGGKTLTLEELDQLLTDQGVQTTKDDTAFRIASNSLTRMIYINDLKSLKSSQEITLNSNSIDSSQPGCSSETQNDGDLYSIAEESSSAMGIDNIHDYDLDDEWGSDLEIVNEAIASPAVKRFFGKASNPVLAYMQAQSGLSQEKILEFIEQNKVNLESGENSKEKGKLKRKKLIVEDNKIFIQKKKRSESESSLENIEEMIRIKEEIHSSGSIQEESIDGIEEIDLGLSPSPKKAPKKVISSDTDSDDFVEVNDVPIPYIVNKKNEKKMEIIVKADEELNDDDDDLFADVFDSEPITFNTSSDLSIEQKINFSNNSFTDVKKVNSSSDSFELVEHLKNDSHDSSTFEGIDSIKETSGSMQLADNSIAEKIESSIEEMSTDYVEPFISNIVNKSVEKKDETISIDNIEQVVTEIDVKLVERNKQMNSEAFKVDSIKPNPIKSIDLLDESITDDEKLNKSRSESVENLSTDISALSENISSISSIPETSGVEHKKKSGRVENVIARLEDDKVELLGKLDKPEGLRDIESQLDKEHKELQKDIGRLERQATEVTEQMRNDAQELLRLFGIPYVVAPQEAEAQCAMLELLNMTDGTITDDSDIWLFGGRCVYKNFFNNAKRVMEYKIKDIEHHFKLTRNQMIQLALLVGSDYTLGITGIGPVTALEVLANFPTEGDDILQGLNNFSKWIRAGKVAGPGRTTLRNKLKNVAIDMGFPSQAVAQAYLFPTVDDSTEPFSWKKPNLVLLGDYIREKFGWSRMKFEEVMGPIIKKMEDHKAQKNILNYFKVEQIPKSIEQNLSKRVQKAVKLLGKEGNDDDDDDNNVEELNEEKKKGRKRRKKLTKKEETLIADVPKDSAEDGKIEEKSAEAESIVQKGKNKEYIPQREKDKVEALKKKQEAITVFNKSKKGATKAGKKPFRRPRNVMKKEADLSESSSDD